MLSCQYVADSIKEACTWVIAQVGMEIWTHAAAIDAYRRYECQMRDVTMINAHKLMFKPIC